MMASKNIGHNYYRSGGLPFICIYCICNPFTTVMLIKSDAILKDCSGDNVYCRYWGDILILKEELMTIKQLLPLGGLNTVYKYLCSF